MGLRFGQRSLRSRFWEWLYRVELKRKCHNLEDAQMKVSRLRRWRWLNRLYAYVRGYFWLPCPICGENFGGHEIVIKDVYLVARGDSLDCKVFEMVAEHLLYQGPHKNSVLVCYKAECGKESKRRSVIAIKGEEI